MQKVIAALACFSIFLSACSPAAEQYQDSSSSNPPAVQPQGESSSSSSSGGSASGSTTSSSSLCPEIQNKFNQIQLGMSYEEVVRILGVEGEMINREPSALGEPSVLYRWKFTVPCTAVLNARFTKNALSGFGYGQS